MAKPWFTIHRSQLHPALTRVLGAVDVRATIPILSHVLFEVCDNVVRLRGTNLDLQIQADCEVLEMTEDKEFALPADRLRGILGNLPETAEISFGPGRTPDQVSIKAGQSTFSVSFLPASDFPAMRGASGDLHFVEVDGARLSDALGKTAYAVLKLEGRVYLTGICLHADATGTGLVAVATDGHLFSRIQLSGSGAPEFPTPEHNSMQAAFPHVIVPPRGAESIRKLLEGAKMPCRIAVNLETIGVTYDGVEITSKLIDAVFPEYARIIPSDSGKTVALSRAALAASVKRISTMMDDEATNPVRFRILSDTIEIDILGSAGNSAHDQVACKASDPEPFEIWFNGKQVEKTLAAIAADDLEMMLTESLRPVVVRPNGLTETYLLNPTRGRAQAQ